MLKFGCFVLFVALAHASDVLEFTDANFDDNIKQHDIALVEFYAPWCGHCKRLAPEYEQAATTLKENDPPVALVKVDCTAETKVCGKHGVSGYPTLKIFKKGEISEDYNGPREAAGITKLMRSKAGPTSKELKSVDDAIKFLDTKEYSVLGFFEEGSQKHTAFTKVADKLSSDLRFAHSFNKDVQAKYKYSDDIVIVRPKQFHNKFEGSEVKYEDSDLGVDAVRKWVDSSLYGLAGHRTRDNMDKFPTPLVIAYYNVDYVKNPKGTNYWRNRVMKVAKKLKDAGRVVNFAVSSSDDMGQELSGDFNLEFKDKPVIAARGSDSQKYVMSGEFSMDNLEKFVTDLLDGKLSPHVKSEAVPENNDGPVKVLVGKNYNDIITEDKDALIEFYAPWCGHCKSLEPKYNELGEKLKDEDVVIAKMDATANDVPPQYQVQGFPTIFFKPAGGSPVQYQGGREVDDFVQYIAKEATKPLKGFSRSGKKTKTEL